MIKGGEIGVDFTIEAENSAVSTAPRTVRQKKYQYILVLQSCFGWAEEFVLKLSNYDYDAMFANNRNCK